MTATGVELRSITGVRVSRRVAFRWWLDPDHHRLAPAVPQLRRRSELGPAHPRRHRLLRAVGVRLDGSIIGGDFRAGYRVSYDLHTFQDLPVTDPNELRIGDLYARKVGHRLEVSRDHQEWLPFSPATARSLLTP